MLSFVHPLPEDLKQGLRLQKVQEPVVIPAEYNYPYSVVVLPGVDCPPEAPGPVFAALAGPDLGVTPAQAWEATGAFLFGCHEPLAEAEGLVSSLDRTSERRPSCFGFTDRHIRAP